MSKIKKDIKGEKPFGPEWHAHMMKWRKKDLIELIISLCNENEKKQR